MSVDADAELTRAIAGESFQAIARQSAEIVQAAGTPKDLEPLLRLRAKTVEPPHPLALLERACVLVGETSDHMT